jgi:MtN3 and saliva related transmembrane protein
MYSELYARGRVGSMMGDVLLETLATIVGVVGSFAMLPQIYRIFKRKSAQDISIWTYAYMLVAGVIWVLYGLNIQSFPILITNLIGSLTMIGVIVGWVLYGRESRRKG